MFNNLSSNVKALVKSEKKLGEKLKNVWEEYKFLLKPFLWITLIFAISLIALIRADFNYCDDLRRVALGFIGWNGFSRFISSFLSVFIHADNYLTDISPLPQLLAVCIMALTGAIILHVYKDDKKFSFWDIIAIIPIGLSPYFLECFSYKYDAPYMALSVFVSVFPLLFRNKGKIVYSIVTFISILIMCMTYQASSGIFLMFVLLLCLKNWNEGGSFKENFKFLILSAANYVIALLIFKIFIMVPEDSYVSNTIFSIKEFIPGVIRNLYTFYLLVLEDFKKEWIFTIGLIGIFFIYVFVRDSKRNKIASFFASGAILGLMAILAFGMYLVLTKPLFAPRSMYGFCVFVALMGVAIAASKKAYLGKIIVLCLSWAFVVFSFTYGNALKVQDEYTDFRINLVISDLNELDVFLTEDIKTLQIDGTIGQSPILRNMPQNYEIINKLVPIQFREEWMWGKYYFFNYFALKNFKENDEIDLSSYELPILKDTMYHTIRGNDEYVLIELK